jgi:hypothetical protein
MRTDGVFLVRLGLRSGLRLSASVMVTCRGVVLPATRTFFYQSKSLHSVGQIQFGTKFLKTVEIKSSAEQARSVRVLLVVDRSPDAHCTNSISTAIVSYLIKYTTNIHVIYTYFACKLFIVQFLYG